VTTEKIDVLLDEKAFWSAAPFPHLIIDNFLQNDFAEEILKTFPSKSDHSWTPYLHFNEIKYGSNRFDKFPSSTQALISFLHSDSFCKKLSGMLNTKLIPDPYLIGGGLHQTFRNGFLNIHTDFSHHPHNTKWKRKLNLILYLNQNWPEQYNGNLEFWDKKELKCLKEIKPIFNKLVVFLTDSNSLHGSPKKLKCRNDESRKSIAIYYYEESDDCKIAATTYFSVSSNLFYKGIVAAENLLLKLFTRTRLLLKFRH